MNRNCAILKLDAIGDFVLWLDAANELIEYEKRRKSKIIIICNSVNINIAKKFVKGIEEECLVDFDDKNRMSKIYEEHFDVLYQCAYNNTKKIDSIVQKIFAEKKIAMKGSKKIYSDFFQPREQWMHEYLKNQEFISNIIGRQIKIRKHCRLETAEKYFAVNPTASMKKRTIELDKVIFAIEYILSMTNLKCILLGTDVNNEIENRIRNDRCINLCGKTTVYSYVDIISKAKFVLGNDSSCIHIAAYCGVPSIVFAGGQHFGKFVPYAEEMKEFFESPTVIYHKLDCYYCDFKIKKKSLECLMSKITHSKFPCIAKITKEDILRELVPFLYKIKNV